MLDKINDKYQENIWLYEKPMNYLTSLYGDDTPKVLSLFKVGYSNGDVIGLGKEREVYRLKDGYIPIDIFTNRLTFPITNIDGEVLGFSARDITNTSNAKYINSPTTPRFKKSEILYGIEYAYPYIKKHNKVYIVEGVTDVIALYLSGIKNVVATLGTSLTKQHINKIRKLTKNIVFMFDNDPAGQKAIEQNYNICSKYAMNVYVYNGILSGHDVYDMYSKKIPFNEEYTLDYVDYTLNIYLDKLAKPSNHFIERVLLFTNVMIPLIHKSASNEKYFIVFEVSNILGVSLNSVLLDIDDYKEIDFDEWLDKICDVIVSDRVTTIYIGDEE